MEVGFNTFYAFRDGETAWIYSKVLHFLHQLTGVTCFSVYPYQLGHENEEAIKSGAFWFYRKLGFRPGRPELLAMTRKRKRRWLAIRRIGLRRAPCACWRQGMCFMNLVTDSPGQWDTFSTRRIGLAVQQRMAEEFDGDPEKLRRATPAGAVPRSASGSGNMEFPRAIGVRKFCVSVVAGARTHAMDEVCRSRPWWTSSAPKYPPMRGSISACLQQHRELERDLPEIGFRRVRRVKAAHV